MCTILLTLSHTAKKLKQLHIHQSHYDTACDEVLTHQKTWALLDPLYTFSSLECLGISTSVELWLGSSGIVHLLAFWPNIQVFELSSQHSGARMHDSIISPAQLGQILETCPSLLLMTVDLSFSSYDYEPAVPISFPYHSNLRELCIQDIPEDVHSLHAALASALPALMRIYCDTDDDTQRDRVRELVDKSGWEHFSVDGPMSIYNEPGGT
jgi:hypothetical protein